MKPINNDVVLLCPIPWTLVTPCTWVKGCPESVDCSSCGAYDAGEMTAHYAESWWYSYQLLNGRMTVYYTLS